MATVGALVIFTLAVAACTIYASCVAPPSAGDVDTSERNVPLWVDSLARRVSLTTTLPPLLCSDVSRHRSQLPGTADLRAMDGIRVLSTCCVILVRVVPKSR